MSNFPKHFFFSSIATVCFLSSSFATEEPVSDPIQKPSEERIQVRSKEINQTKLETSKRRRARENGIEIPEVQESSYPFQKAKNILASNAQWMLSPLNEALPECRLAYAYLPVDSHWYTNVATNWGSFEIEDGSRWEISPSDQHILYNWRRDDILVITPNSSWFSPYDYYVTNATNNTYVKANLLEGPIAFGPYSHWVVDIDYVGGHIFLDNQMVWCIDPKDGYLLSEWSINDHVIFGANDSLFSKYNFILINVNMEEHLRAKQY